MFCNKMQHGSQSHGFAVRVWSNLCIFSLGVVEIVRSNMAPDFPLFHDLTIFCQISWGECSFFIYFEHLSRAQFIYQDAQ